MKSVDEANCDGYVLLPDGNNGAAETITAKTKATPAKKQNPNHHDEIVTERCIACLKIMVVLLFLVYIAIFTSISGRFERVFSFREVTPLVGRTTIPFEENDEQMIALDEFVPQAVQRQRSSRSLDRNTFSSATMDGRVLVHFYAPWCSHCKCAANILNKFAVVDPEISIAQVNCMENPHLCRQQTVFAFPTIRLYEYGRLQGWFDETVLSVSTLQDFVQRVGVEEKDPIHKKNVQLPVLNSYNVDRTLKLQGTAFVVFVPEQCYDRCQELADTWHGEDARNFKEGFPARIFRVVCTEDPDLCRDAGVSAHEIFPEIRWYQHGDLMIPRYAHSLLAPPNSSTETQNKVPREAEVVDSAVQDDDAMLFEEAEEHYDDEMQFEPEILPTTTTGPREAMSNVKFLTYDTFESFLKEHMHVFVFFFAPWCVWSQRAMSEWSRLAQKMADSSVEIVAIDCVEEEDLCQGEENIIAFPTFRWYEKGDAEESDYKMDRTVSALSAYAHRKIEAYDGVLAAARASPSTARELH